MNGSAVGLLRSRTRGWHDTLEHTEFAVAMLAGSLPVELYVGQLAAYRPVLAALEDELTRSACPAVARVWSAELAKVPYLDRDLGHFAASGVLPRPALVAAEVRAFTGDVRETARTEPEGLLGFLYVLEGSTMGALYLRGPVSAAYGLSDGAGLAYYGSGDRARWKAVAARLDEALPGARERERAVRAAERAYAHTAAVSRALSPAHP
ncbi:biliverdin-producing heme oxygenase [Streptomyces roseirectus]|uniref:Biliverdin-producing heme oxygenase n=1 Tax=Streptomyces roseirectus TaxID=2768066 RepID=A0A7H0IJ78_9ACTN|nr:biliverdin-producing heme oxygenase [Streptomyces roseirectus]QNP72844.1 biliverdin-producing heme oxygenase [Streptomyces roseirectus]